MKAYLFLVTAIMTTSSYAAVYNPGSISQTWAGSQIIPDNQASGVAFAFDLTSPTPATIYNVTVDLNIVGGWNGDLYAYLSHGNGFSVLLNRIGSTGGNPSGSGGSGINVNLSDVYSTDIHLVGNASISGQFAPDGRNSNPLTALNTDPRDALLSTFTGLNPDGAWTLFFSDVSPFATSTLQSWTVTISTVPEPSVVALFVLVAALLYFRARNSAAIAQPAKAHTRASLRKLRDPSRLRSGE